MNISFSPIKHSVRLQKNMSPVRFGDEVNPHAEYPDSNLSKDEAIQQLKSLLTFTRKRSFSWMYDPEDKSAFGVKYLPFASMLLDHIAAKGPNYKEIEAIDQKERSQLGWMDRFNAFWGSPGLTTSLGVAETICGYQEEGNWEDFHHENRGNLRHDIMREDQGSGLLPDRAHTEDAYRALVGLLRLPVFSWRYRENAMRIVELIAKNGMSEEDHQYWQKQIDKEKELAAIEAAKSPEQKAREAKAAAEREEIAKQHARRGYGSMGPGSYLNW